MPQPHNFNPTEPPPGLADDLDAISTITDLGAGNDVAVDFTSGSHFVFVEVGTGHTDSWSEIVAHPALHRASFFAKSRSADSPSWVRRKVIPSSPAGRLMVQLSSLPKCPLMTQSGH